MVAPRPYIAPLPPCCLPLPAKVTPVAEARPQLAICRVSSYERAIALGPSQTICQPAEIRWAS